MHLGHCKCFFSRDTSEENKLLLILRGMQKFQLNRKLSPSYWAVLFNCLDQYKKIYIATDKILSRWTKVKDVFFILESSSTAYTAFYGPPTDRAFCHRWIVSSAIRKVDALYMRTNLFTFCIGAAFLHERNKKYLNKSFQNTIES